MAHAGGRPSKYTTKLGNDICQRIAEGESLRAICRDKDMPNASTVHLWAIENDKFSKQYEKARIMQAGLMFEDLLAIADREDGDTNRDRLRVDTRKWFLSKVAPKIYGDKLHLGGDKENPLEINVTGVEITVRK